MKLRILGDTLRVRLAQAEVVRLRQVGQVDQSIHFGAEPEAAMRYVVKTQPDATTITASLEQRSIVVRIPESVAASWADSTEVSLRASQTIDAQRSLSILIEKDFKCLVPRTGEEDSDGFPNPSA